MAGEKNLTQLVKSMSPRLNRGEYVFVTVEDISKIDRGVAILEFKEEEGITLVLEKSKADKLGLSYEFIAAWITLNVHSSLEAVGLTAMFSTELAMINISCNVIAGYYNDHIFVDIKDADRALQQLMRISI